MKLYKPLELPLLYDSDESKVLESAGMSPDDDSYVTRIATFYDITSIMPRDHDKNEVTVIYSDGVSFYVPMSYQDTKKLVDEAMM